MGDRRPINPPAVFDPSAVPAAKRKQKACSGCGPWVTDHTMSAHPKALANWYSEVVADRCGAPSLRRSFRSFRFHERFKEMIVAAGYAANSAEGERLLSMEVAVPAKNWDAYMGYERALYCPGVCYDLDPLVIAR